MNVSVPEASPPDGASGGDCKDLAIITVTYHPDLVVLASQLSALPALALKVVVDNASPEAARGALRRLTDSVPRSILIENTSNLGLPAALNKGTRQAMELAPECRYLLFLDQDTEPAAGAVAELLHGYKRLVEQGRNPGCVGPRLVDATSEMEHGFHQISGWRWVRRFPADTDAVVECANLNCSGTLQSVELFARLGGLDESLFMDHLDTEWAFRTLAAGFGVYGLPAAVFRHRMGQATWRIWLFGWRIWPYRTPRRHFFLFRNAVWLMRRDYVPGVWKFWAALKLCVTALVHLLMDSQRWPQLASMVSGIRAGLQSPAQSGSRDGHRDCAGG